METLATVAVSIPERSVRNDIRAVKIVWQRDIIRFFRDKPRIATALIQPMLYLFILGTGLSSAGSAAAGASGNAASGLDLRTFLFPGVMSMAVLFTCFFSAGSMVWDREFGFMREMLVAPVRRSAIILGKCLGGATTGVFQGVLVLLLAPLVGVPFTPGLIITVLLQMSLLAFALSAVAVMIAARIRAMQSFFALMQMILMPLFFMSGALFPVGNLPAWLEVLTRIDPLTYAVDPMRKTILAEAMPNLPISGVTWSGWPVPTWLELAIVAAFGLIALLIAVWQFDRAD
ncbi:MAG: ABC transporter permease [Myxococcota bacterium]